MQYPIQFAQKARLSVGPGRVRDQVNDCRSTREAFLADPENWLTANGSRYTQRQMEEQWLTIEFEKRRVQSLWDRLQNGLQNP